MFNVVSDFESTIAKFFGSPYAVATDSCTHAIELCLRLKEVKRTTCPIHTYLSIPLTLAKLDIDFKWKNTCWNDYYYLEDTNILDAAVFWKQNGYIEKTLMCLSFQYKKHLGLGRGGMILTDNHDDYQSLIKMSYDGRGRDLPWADQQISTFGFHYYMTPEVALLGIKKFQEIKDVPVKAWSYLDYPDLRNSLRNLNVRQIRNAD